MSGTRHDDLIDRLRNAVAKDKLFVVTGAGVSYGVKREKGGRLLSWGQLVSALKKRATTAFKQLDKPKAALLKRLTPRQYMDEVHGDALIEASEIIQGVTNPRKFGEWVADETREKSGECGSTHRCIARLPLRGVITFNYDQCQESAFRDAGVQFDRVLYCDDDLLTKHLNQGFVQPTMLLKAHGCVSVPKTLILTSSSYARILNEQNAYRAVVQHILSRFTVLVVGFALRDRDFEQMLNTLEKDFGSGVQDYIAIMRDTKKSSSSDREKERHVQEANFAALEARYGLNVLTVNDFSEIPGLLESLHEEPGDYINELTERCTATRSDARSDARSAIRQLSEVGRRQIRESLMRTLSTDRSNLTKRSELLYALSLVGENEAAYIEVLVSECETRSVQRSSIGTAECIAHALSALRSAAIKDKKLLIDVESRLADRDLLTRLTRLDDWLKYRGGNPRLVHYANAAVAELRERASSYGVA